jgi:hypothetical protein
VPVNLFFKGGLEGGGVDTEASPMSSFNRRLFSGDPMIMFGCSCADNELKDKTNEEKIISFTK